MLFSDEVSKKDVPVTDCRVNRLPYKDMSLYGICPENDQFSAVICGTCDTVVKAQALKRHIEIKHPGSFQNFSPPKQLFVRKSRPNLLSKKSLKEPVTTTSINCATALDNASNSTTITAPTLQPVVSLKPIESTPITSVKSSIQLSPSKPPATTAPTDPEVANSTNTQRRKSPNLDRKRPRERDYDTSTDSPSSSARTTPLKSTANPQKRPHTSPTPMVVSHELSSSARTTPLKSTPNLQKRPHTSPTPMVVFHQLSGASNNNSCTNTSSNNNSSTSNNSKQFVTSSSRKLVDSYQRKPCTKITVWGHSETDSTVHINHHKDSTHYKTAGNNNNNAGSTGTQRTKEFTNAEHNNASPVMTTTSNEWQTVNVARMVMHLLII